MGNASVRLSPRELYQLKWMLGASLALISMWSVWFLGIGAGVLVVVCMAMVAGVMLWPRLPGRLPSAAWKAIPVLLMLVIAGDFLVSGTDLIPPLIRAILLLLTFRALEYRTRRHDLQLVLLGLFIVVMSGVLSMELSFALQVVLFTPVAMLVLFTVTLSETAAGDAPEVPRDPWNGFGWRHFGGRLLKVMDHRLLLFTAALFAATAMTAALMFVALPRFELGQALPFLRLKAQQSLSGFSESVSFGDVVEIIQNDSVALRADVAGERPTEAPYWRMLALDAYDGRTFHVSESAREANRTFAEYRLDVGHQPSNSEAGSEWTVYFEGGVARFLPLPGRFTRIRFQSRQDLVYNPWLQTLGLREVPGNVLFYQMDRLSPADWIPATSADEALAVKNPEEAGLAGAAAAWRYPATTLALPDDDATRVVLEEAQAAITGGQELTLPEYVERAVHWLQSRHSYSLETSIPPGEGDALARWMAWGEGGHCELFAGSFVLLARHAGIPARLVTGFHGGDWNGFENYFMVRNAHAHAWVEVFDGRSRWLRVDPTPGSGRPGETALAAGGGGGPRQLGDRTLGAYLDSLRVLWYRRIVNFDQRQQRELMSDLRSRTRAGYESIRETLADWMSRAQALFSHGWTWREILAAAPGVISGLALIAAGILLWRILGRQVRRRPSSGHRIRRRAGRWLYRLGAVASAGHDSQMLREVHAELLVLRYGSQNEWPDPQLVFRRAAKALRRRKYGGSAGRAVTPASSG